jgi:hypothetical protein
LPLLAREGSRALRGGFLRAARSYGCSATQGTHQGRSLAAASSGRWHTIVARSSLIFAVGEHAPPIGWCWEPAK